MAVDAYAGASSGLYGILALPNKNVLPSSHVSVLICLFNISDFASQIDSQRSSFTEPIHAALFKLRDAYKALGRQAGYYEYQMRVEKFEAAMDRFSKVYAKRHPKVQYQEDAFAFLEKMSRVFRPLHVPSMYVNGEIVACIGERKQMSVNLIHLVTLNHSVFNPAASFADLLVASMTLEQMTEHTCNCYCLHSKKQKPLTTPAILVINCPNRFA